MIQRTIEDRLREEYFDLLPGIRRVAHQLESEVKYHILGIAHSLQKYEQVQVVSRIKDCTSALEALRRRQEFSTFDRDTPEKYTLLSLPDLAGVRVLAFPSNRLSEIDNVLRRQFPLWTSDPVPMQDRSDGILAHKYYGYCPGASSSIQGEYQVVPMLIGLFWEVEHAAIYKPAPRLKGIAESPEMQEHTRQVQAALRSFEEKFEALIRSQSLDES
jgi:hypothetical protein